MKSAVVFAYHNVGVRCIKALLAAGIEIKLIVTHEDNPSENIWFGSVAQLASDYEIPCMTPENPNTPEIEAQIAALNVDFLFSFYYRNMLKAPLLSAPEQGAFNMHGSLLPQYRGRVPINWAIIKGETETGATLHVMNIKPDNGPIVAQQAVPIFPDDTAQEVFEKVTVAAELCLSAALPRLIAGKTDFTQQDLSQGAYYGGRTAKDGQINWQQSAKDIHNLVRAVTVPYPGAFSDIDGKRLIIWRTRQIFTSQTTAIEPITPLMYADGNRIILLCSDGAALLVLHAEFAGETLNGNDFTRHFGASSIDLH
ncbi:formyltransferase [Janthinobacterium sp. B9-8]|uniref:formyltransferase n=1 Tax=Janthinobacterium sp. B9-8 TaxID=1236179 RepID=UPI00061CF765|nr:formyltransferase [Janthinobacterium sp. B9-8]AMC34152.1 formyltransferase [Janthinobacterium sp. B9-8]